MRSFRYGRPTFTHAHYAYRHRYLSFLFIDPKAQGKGVGGALLSWGLEKADAANPPLPVVLESSPVGRPIYEKKGFQIVDTIVLKDVAEFPFMIRPAKGSPN